MDLLTFVAKVIEFLAWPLASIVLVVLLRREIRHLLPLVKRLKAGPLEAEFEREVRELRSSAEAGATIKKEDLPTLPSMAVKLAEVNPRSAIQEAWREIETTARQVLLERTPQLTEASLRSTREVIRQLGQTNVLSQEDIALLHEMRFLRNQAVHVDEFRPTYDAALSFTQVAALLLQRMRPRLQ